MRPSKAIALLLSFSLLASGCSTFSLREQTGVLPVGKQRRASEGVLVVMPFFYAPEDPEDASDLTPEDLARWQELLATGIDQTNIFATTVAAKEGEAPAVGEYVLSGQISRFRFQKNWVPIFFPLHLFLSFFTFTGYTLFGGPTTGTLVRFTVHFDLREIATGKLVASFDENFSSTRAVNIYSKGAENPYDNPNLVLAQVVTQAARKIAAALPYPPLPGAPAAAAPPGPTPVPSELAPPK